jgi:hypothetical protein
MPFVQGHLRNESLAVTIRTECGHCSRSIRIEVDSELNYLVDFEKLKDPSIIDAF